MPKEILRCGVWSPTLFGKPKRILLVDCNNFYASCERVFNPSLIGKPVVILSSNDGCVIARSNEAKALDIPMGAPAFQYDYIFKKHKVHVFSSNFALYGDMSARVMQVLASHAADIEVYSVDEAFLHIVDYAHEQDNAYYAAQAQLLIRKVKQYTGIPISIGIGPTKTLAKIANKIAKKSGTANYFDITDRADADHWLEQIEVGEIWGVGRRYAKLLIAHNITTAYALKYASDEWVRKKMTINGLKMVHELRGIPCFGLDEGIEPNKSFVVSRSFGHPITTLHHLQQAAATHAVTGACKLRQQGSMAAHVTAFVLFRHYQDDQRLYESASVHLPLPTSFTPTIISAVKACIEKIYKPGLIYKKVGIMLNDIVSQDQLQMNLYTDSSNRKKHTDAMCMIDSINTKWGINTLTFAATGINQPWKSKKEKCSARYTTSWHELLEIK